MFELEQRVKIQWLVTVRWIKIPYKYIYVLNNPPIWYFSTLLLASKKPSGCALRFFTCQEQSVKIPNRGVFYYAKTKNLIDIPDKSQGILEVSKYPDLDPKKSLNMAKRNYLQIMEQVLSREVQNTILRLLI